MNESVASGGITTSNRVPTDVDKHVDATQKRPLDRMYRPAPDESPIPDLAVLEKELAISLGELDAQPALQPKKSRLPKRAKQPANIAKTPPYISVTPPLSTMLSATAASALQSVGQRPRQKVSLGRRVLQQLRPTGHDLQRLLLLVIVCLSAALGYVLAERIVLGRAAQPVPVQQTQQSQPAQPAATSQADAEWEAAKQQWECTLQQYQSGQQNADTNATNAKETSCATN